MVDRPLRRVLADNLRALMDASPDLNKQLRLSKRTGIGQATIDRILRCEVGTSIDVVEKLADAFGVSPHTLLHPNPPLAQMEAEFYSRMRGLLQEQSHR